MRTGPETAALAALAGTRSIGAEDLLAEADFHRLRDLCCQRLEVIHVPTLASAKCERIDSSAMAQAVVVGAGIGGLATAIALRSNRVPAVVLERAPELGKVEVGAGITLWPNAVRVLERLGVAEEVYSRGSALHRFEQRTWRGRLLARWRLDAMASRLGAPVVGINRPDLHAALASVARDSVQTGSEAVGFEDGGAGVTVALSDGRTVAGEVLIGADGIESVIRAQLMGPARPRYSGLSMWRANLQLAEVDMPDCSFLAFWGPAAKFVAYRAGPGLLSWEGVFASERGVSDPAGGAKLAALERFTGWCDPVTPIIAATDDAAILRTDVVDRPPTERWGSGRVTLLGDAAHPMTFAVGQGAAQALEDAVVVADALRGDGGDPVARLRSYEQQRIPRAAHFQTLAWRLARIGVVRRAPARLARSAFIKGSSRLAMRIQERDMAVAV